MFFQYDYVLLVILFLFIYFFRKPGYILIYSKRRRTGRVLFVKKTGKSALVMEKVKSRPVLIVLPPVLADFVERFINENYQYDWMGVIGVAMTYGSMLDNYKVYTSPKHDPSVSKFMRYPKEVPSTGRRPMVLKFRLNTYNEAYMLQGATKHGLELEDYIIFNLRRFYRYVDMRKTHYFYYRHKGEYKKFVIHGPNSYSGPPVTFGIFDPN
ncbi:MAG: hypothetical protein ACPGO5_04825 [Patescibacteria group bacterium]